jgi:hypothetical protein
MLAVPDVDPEKVIWHDAVPAVVPATRVHGFPLKEPVTPVWLKVTEPVGLMTVPEDEVSVTVPVHVVV